MAGSGTCGYIFNCDPGADDALALIMACSSPEISLVGVLAASGNAPTRVTASNAKKILELCGREDVPVYLGASTLMSGEKPLFDSAFCGNDGLCDTGLFVPGRHLPEAGGIEWLTKTLLDSEKPLGIISTAPLTDIALALERTPRIAGKIGRIITTAGYYGVCGDGKAPRKEWNAAADPFAVKTVFDSHVPIYALGLDVTGKLTDELAERIVQASGNSVRGEFFRRARDYCLSAGLKPFSLLVDAMAVAFAVRPDIAVFTKGTVSVCAEEPFEADSMLLRPSDACTANVHAAIDFSFEMYEMLLKERVFYDETGNVK